MDRMGRARRYTYRKVIKKNLARDFDELAG